METELKGGEYGWKRGKAHVATNVPGEQPFKSYSIEQPDVRMDIDETRGLILFKLQVDGGVKLLAAVPRGPTRSEDRIGYGYRATWTNTKRG